MAIEIAERQRMAGYRMPPEWGAHLATYLVWPHNRDTWPGKFEAIPPFFAQMAAAIAHFEPVRILVPEEAKVAQIREAIINAPAPDRAPVRIDRIELLPIATNDSWIRDYGPIFVNCSDGGTQAQIATAWRFNSWGEKYGDYSLDNLVSRRLAERFGFDLVQPGIVLEGGSIEINGAGSLLTTESCLLNRNRNPGLSRSEIEEYLRVYLGVEQIFWLGAGIAGDDTDGHVDDLARFTAPDMIVTVIEEDPADDNYAPLQDNLRRLQAMRNRHGGAFRIAKLPMPAAVYEGETRVPASYANYYVVNGGVLMPSFGCAADKPAQATLERLFPGRRVVTIPSRELVWGLGAIHCLTQQHPAAASR